MMPSFLHWMMMTTSNILTIITAGIILMMVMVLILWESITDNIIFANNLFNVYFKELIIIIIFQNTINCHVTVRDFLGKLSIVV